MMQRLTNIFIFILAQLAISGVVAVITFCVVCPILEINFLQLWVALSVLRINRIKSVE